MWVYNSDYERWEETSDKLVLSDFDFLKQELSAVRFYSKCLSGATFLPVNDLDNIYDILGNYQPRNWYIDIDGSPYTNTNIPSEYAKKITATTSYDYYTKYIDEYGLTLKNLFTPNRLINDSIKNYIEVDVATTEELLDLPLVVVGRMIDGIRLKEGHTVLIKDQIDTVVLPNTVNPDTYFLSPYTVFQNLGATIEYRVWSSDNGIYKYLNNRLIKQNTLDDYDTCRRFSVVVKNGVVNFDKQFHLVRLLNGYYPTSKNQEPFKFIEKKNWMFRNRVDYNNLFEINYYDVIKNPTQSFYSAGITYSIPERIISVGEFGIIHNNQAGVSNFIANKYKVNLRSVSQTNGYYWICGDDGILLKVRKYDFNIERVALDNITTNLKSVSFFNDLKGAVVGDLNVVYITENGGHTWNRIRISAFDPYYFNKVVYHSPNSFFVAGNVGILIEFKNDITGWTAYKKRISRQIDDDDEYLLVDNINDIFYTTMTTWGLSYSYFTQSIPPDKAMLFITTDDSKLIIHDINGFTNFSFLYLDFPTKYGDIRNITRKFQTNEFYFTGIEETTGGSGLFSFNLSDFSYVGVGNSYSNTINATYSANYESELYGNEIFDYFGQDLLICGNESLLQSSTYSSPFNFDILDLNFEKRLKSKMLFIDYDLGSKLNFFTDFGEYRLPNSLTFSFPAGAGTYFDFSSLIYSAVSPSYLTQSEVSWIDYWRDNQMTFEYHSINPMQDVTKVLINKTFSYSTASQFTVSSISNDVNQFLSLMPSILDEGHSRYYGIGLTAISATTFSSDIYIYDYLMVSKLPSYFTVNVGDVMKFESGVVDGNFVVNRIETLSGDKYIWMFTDFNQNITTQLTSTYSGTFSNSVKLTNLNKYSSLSDLVDRFNQHPFSKAYQFSIDNSDGYTELLMDFSYGGLTNSYTNWSFSGGFTTSFNFPTNTSIGAPLTTSPYSFRTVAVGDTSIETPNVIGVEEISFSYKSNASNYSPSPTFSYINVQGFSGSSWYDVNTTVIADGFAGQFQNTVNFSVGNYSKFRFNIRTSAASANFFSPFNYKFITIDDLKLTSTSGLYIDETSYGLSSGDIDLLKIEPKFNNFTSYYNLATNVNTQNSTFTMSYTDGFLKFGYTPTYNLLDYLESINDFGDPNPKFYASKEYYAMPDYRQIPMPGLNSFTLSTVYIDYNGMTAAQGLTVSERQDNRLLFDNNLILEWQSIFVNTFVDINLYATASVTTTERALVTKKYSVDDPDIGLYYVIEFHRPLNYVIGQPLYYCDIISRRKLSQISDDLQQLNLIQRPEGSVDYIGGSGMNLWFADFKTYQREMNYKVNTDSYAKILLSDVDTIQSLSAILYSDYKNELAMNITKLGRQYNIPILNTANFGGKLFISCLEKHGLKDDEGVVLEFTGATGSSQFLNQQYFGYHPVKKVNEYNFYVNIPYGSIPTIGNDSGFVKYYKQDPFLNYLPVDLIDIGVDKRGRRSIELTTENTVQSGPTFSLSGVDFTKYRFRLVDGLNIESLAIKYPWIYEAEVSGAVIGEINGELAWYKGYWECGRWFGGNWISGYWKSGDWYGGTWNSKLVKDNYINVEVDENSSGLSHSTWITGRWYDGTWNNGIWTNGRWYGGTWNDGVWYKGIWNDGTWNNGKFNGGIWVLGNWWNGIFNTDNEPAYWLDGYWYGGDFENGMWYNGTFDSVRRIQSRFGVKAYNSRTATWHGGKWIRGSFHSKLNLNDDDEYDVSDVHKYSIWYTGQWFDGDFYGGVAYNMDFKSGTWHGGILEDIQVIGVTGSTVSSDNYFTLNGIFKFNIGDQIHIIDNQIGNSYSTLFGSNDNEQKYNVLYTVEGTYSYLGEVRKKTNVYVDRQITTFVTPPVDMGLRVVSKFTNCNWKSGIWTNGLFETGYWEGGIWYGGVFGQDAVWM